MSKPDRLLSKSAAPAQLSLPAEHRLDKSDQKGATKRPVQNARPKTSTVRGATASSRELAQASSTDDEAGDDESADDEDSAGEESADDESATDEGSADEESADEHEMAAAARQRPTMVSRRSRGLAASTGAVIPPLRSNPAPRAAPREPGTKAGRTALAGGQRQPRETDKRSGLAQAGGCVVPPSTKPSAVPRASRTATAAAAAGAAPARPAPASQAAATEVVPGPSEAQDACLNRKPSAAAQRSFKRASAAATVAVAAVPAPRVRGAATPKPAGVGAQKQQRDGKAAIAPVLDEGPGAGAEGAAGSGSKKRSRPTPLQLQGRPHLRGPPGDWTNEQLMEFPHAEVVDKVRAVISTDKKAVQSVVPACSYVCSLRALLAGMNCE